MRLTVKIPDAILSVPATLSEFTTYVLLEQESWFEKEAPFVRALATFGITAIDIGANLGVYSVPMASRTGKGGHVFAYEPGGPARLALEANRHLNNLSNLHISEAALSDYSGFGTLSMSGAEYRALTPTADGERVPVVNLDKEDTDRGWPSPDFVKIDAEGHDARIMRGGKRFFFKSFTAGNV